MSDHKAIVTIEWDGDDEAGRTVIQNSLDGLMARLLAAPAVVDPDISASLNARIENW